MDVAKAYASSLASERRHEDAAVALLSAGDAAGRERDVYARAFINYEYMSTYGQLPTQSHKGTTAPRGSYIHIIYYVGIHSLNLRAD